MKMRNKGKVHPFTTSSSINPNKDDNLSVLNLLPAAIFTLVSILSPEEREVLAYLITRSLQSEKQQKQHSSKSPALFDCDCFHCYTSFWFRWDSSPNRELIHHAIEAFEEHLNNNGDHDHEFNLKKNVKINNKKKEKISRRKIDIPVVKEENIPAVEEVVENIPAPVVVAVQQSRHTHKGLARKVLPDVMGIFNSRLWSLWSPNV